MGEIKISTYLDLTSFRATEEAAVAKAFDLDRSTVQAARSDLASRSRYVSSAPTIRQNF